ncbi:hypothetical protein BJ742DRAFT_875279, partial [Cladochytrium replicatum]
MDDTEIGSFQGVGELAKEAKGITKTSRFPSVPLQLLLMGTMFPAIALAIVPACFVLFKTMETSTSSLSQVILADTMAKVISGITTELMVAEYIATAIASNPSIVDLFSGSPPYYQDRRINLFMFDQLAQTEALKQSILYPTTGEVIGLPKKAPFPLPNMGKMIFPCQVLDSCPPMGVWKAEIFERGYSLTFGKCARGSPVSFGASIVVDGSTVIKKLLTSLRPTSNSRLFAVSLDWRLIVTSNNASDLNNTNLFPLT